MDRRRLTIAVINYNYERFLRGAIDSALGQTHDNVEVVVVDDGSTDNSAEIIRSYGNRVVAVLKPNGGQASAINAAFAAASGDVVVFLDADDLVDPGMADEVLARFASGPDVAWVMYRLRIIDAQGRATGRVRPHRAGVMPNGDLRAHLAGFRCFHWQPTSGNAFARTALAAVLPMPEPAYRISADAYLAGVIPVCGAVLSSDLVGGSYRIHGDSHFTSVGVDDAYFRTQIRRTVDTHEHVVRIAAEQGVAMPRDVRKPQDAALLGFRLASLLLDPRRHPFPEDRRSALVVDGIAAAVRNPQLAWPNRARRAAWFAACGLLPRGLARRLATDAAPDTPARRVRQVRRTVGSG